MSEFKKLLGNRVYLEMPKKDESNIMVDENTKDALNKELIKKMRKLKVVGIGVGVTDNTINIGDYVLVEPEALSRKAVVVPISDERELLLVSYFDIIHIWEG